MANDGKTSVFLSSTGEGLSTTVQGVLMAIVPVAVIILQSQGADITQNDLSEVVKFVVGAISAVVTAYGAVRRIYYKVNRLGKYAE